MQIYLQAINIHFLRKTTFRQKVNKNIPCLQMVSKHGLYISAYVTYWFYTCKPHTTHILNTVSLYYEHFWILYYL